MKKRVAILLFVLCLRIVFLGSDRLFDLPVENLVSLGLDWREKMAVTLSGYLTEPESSLVMGIVLGHQASLSKDFYEQLKRSGTIHMVVASGYNVMVVANMALAVLLFSMKRRVAIWVCLIMIFGYVVLTGAEISVVRAGLMAVVVLMGSSLGRQARGWWSLLLVAWLLILFDPLVVVDISFQLSVAATFGVLVLAPFLEQKMIESDMVLKGLLEKTEFVSTLSAMICTWPVIWIHFGQGSVISLFSNLVILPLVPVVMGLGAVTLGLSLFFEPLAVLTSYPTYAVTHLLVVLVKWFGTL